MEYRGASSSTRIVFWTFGFVAALYGAWIGAWLLEEALVHQYSWLATDAGQFAYWTLMKLALWVLPALVLIRLSGQRIQDVIAISRWRSALLWGSGVGLVLGASAVLPALLLHQPLLRASGSWAFVNAVIVAPIVEELTFRGAVLGGLSKHYRFAVANTLTALFFLGAHLPGWY
ncbi:MAG TPA: CPBP family intramembrane glutamic endopeptidase, partial [Ktedonobacterales bacterium]|nr:CPBP family intramembrane glutamic endopeptidase [Ktedonobacterales bacterium]